MSLGYPIGCIRLSPFILMRRLDQFDQGILLEIHEIQWNLNEIPDKPRKIASDNVGPLDRAKYQCGLELY